MSYCPGKNCSKKDKCQKHYNSGQVIDWSTSGHGSGGIDKDGKYFSYHETYCGDNGTYGYAQFEQYIPPEEIKSNF